AAGAVRGGEGARRAGGRAAARGRGALAEPGVARAGQEIANPVTGERIRFVRTAADTGGELLEIEDTWPVGRRPPPHAHPEMEARDRAGLARVRRPPDRAAVAAERGPASVLRRRDAHAPRPRPAIRRETAAQRETGGPLAASQERRGLGVGQRERPIGTEQRVR